MKKLILISVLCFFIGVSRANETQTIKPVPQVDERVELMNIVFQLAGAPEYSGTFVTSYANDITTYFEPFKEHPLIQWIPALRMEYGISYDAVASYAIHLQIESGKISFLDPANREDLDSRWTQETAEEFLVKLNQFYTESKFNVFFNQHAALYQSAENNFSNVLDNVNFEWFEKFYGPAPDYKFRIILCITDGKMNYGPSRVDTTTGQRDLFAIMGTWAMDNAGNPAYSNDVLLTLIHEFNHSFCNPLVNQFYSELEEKITELYNLNPNIFIMRAYGNPKFTMYEILVRACVIQYFKSINMRPEKIKHFIHQNKQEGFVWIDKLCDELDVYEKERDKYPTLASFMPHIVQMVNNLSVDEIAKEHEANSVRIESVSIADGATDVDPNTASITVTFSKPMRVDMNGASYGRKGADYFPVFNQEKIPFWNKENRKEWTFYVVLKPDTEYSLSFPSQFFVGEKGEVVAETYFLDFKTGK